MKFVTRVSLCIEFTVDTEDASVTVEQKRPVISSWYKFELDVEPVFFVEGVLAPDAEELRRPVRARHLERIAALREAGVVLEAGALGDLSASVLIVRAADAEAAREIARQDVYLAAGVWVEIVTLLVAAIVIAARFIWVYPAFYLPRFLSRRLRASDPYPSWRTVFVIGFTGVRGMR